MISVTFKRVTSFHLSIQAICMEDANFKENGIRSGKKIEISQKWHGYPKNMGVIPKKSVISLKSEPNFEYNLVSITSKMYA